MISFWQRKTGLMVRQKTIFDDLEDLDELDELELEEFEKDANSDAHWANFRLRRPRLRRVTVFLLLVDILVFTAIVYMLGPLITLLVRNNELFKARFLIQDLHNATTAIPSSAKNDKAIQIPKILHQTSKTAELPEEWVLSRQSCLDVYSDFEYKHWTDKSARAFIAEEYPWFLEMWDGYPFPIQRADAIRYFILHHYGGLYLDMDTLCKKRIPIEEINTEGGHYALFKSTIPTGVTNDFMLTTAKHPVYAGTIAKLPRFFQITHFWSKMEPYTAIMMSSGPLFLTLAVQEYLLKLPSLPTSTIAVATPPSLFSLITDLESSSWHQSDTHLLMWMGDRPWTWYTLGVIAFALVVLIFNHLLLVLCKMPRKALSMAYTMKIIR